MAETNERTNQIALDEHELVTLRHRDHLLIQQLEKDCSNLRKRVDVLETGLKWLRDNPSIAPDALRDIAITVLDSGDAAL